MKKVLVTGGAGFIGSHIADALIGAGYKVVIVDDLSSGSKKNINPSARFFKTDIRDARLEEIFSKERPEAVFHLAAQVDVRRSVKDPVSDARANIIGSLNLFENCRKYGVKKIIFSSTGGAIYGEAGIVPALESCPAKPLSPYGIAKFSTENYLRFYGKVFGLDYAILRYANVYGPRQKAEGEAAVLPIFISSMLKGQQPLIYGNGRQTRDFVYIGDVVRANMLALKNSQPGCYNIGTGKETDINDLFDAVAENFGNAFFKKYDPARPGEVERSCLNPSMAASVLGWKPETGLDEGIRKTVEYFKKLNG